VRRVLVAVLVLAGLARTSADTAPRSGTQVRVAQTFTARGRHVSTGRMVLVVGATPAGPRVKMTTWGAPSGTLSRGGTLPDP